MNTVILLLAVMLLVILTGILASLLHAEHKEKITGTNKKVVLHGGKNVNPDAAANGDGIIGEDMSLDDTVVRCGRGAKQTQMLCLTELKSRKVYRGRFYKQQILIGRMEGCAGNTEEGRLFVEDSKVSHVHCRIFRGKDGYMVEDCHSTNHTWVNGKPVADAVPLKEGDQLKLARRSYQVQFLSEYG